MQITATARFRHGHDTYEAGQEYDVPAPLAGYFVMSGWATSDEPELATVDAEPQPDEVTLEVDGLVQDQAATDAG